MQQPQNALSDDHPGRWSALTLLAATLVLSMSTWLSAGAIIPQLR
jgi:hypothetical protein